MEEKEKSNVKYKLLYKIIFILLGVILVLLCCTIVFMIYTDLTHEEYRNVIVPDNEKNKKNEEEDKKEITKVEVLSSDVFDFNTILKDYSIIDYDSVIDNKEYSIIDNKLYNNNQLVDNTSELNITKIVNYEVLYLLDDEGKLYIYNNNKLEQILLDNKIDNITIKEQIVNSNYDEENIKILVLINTNKKDYILNSDYTIKLYDEFLKEITKDITVINNKEKPFIAYADGNITNNNDKELLTYKDKVINSKYIIIDYDQLFYIVDDCNLYSYDKELVLLGKYNSLNYKEDEEKIELVVKINDKEYTFNKKIQN